jgi:hypothetical protein
MASLHPTPTRTSISKSSINTSNPTYISIQSVLASLSSARAATETKVTPHVSTTLNPSTTQTGTGSGAGAGITSAPTFVTVTAADGKVLESQIGGSITVGSEIVVSTSRAAAVAGNGREVLGNWPSVVELGAGIAGLLLGGVGVF